MTINSREQYHVGNFDEAIALARNVVERDPTYGPAWYVLAMALAAKQMNEEALQAFHKVTELRSSGQSLVLDSYEKIAGHHYRERQYDDAISNAKRGIEAFETVRTQHKSTAGPAEHIGQFYVIMGFSYYRQQHLDEAMEAFIRVTNGSVPGGYSDPDKAQAYYGKGLCNMQEKKFAAALSDLDVAVRKLGPDSGYTAIDALKKKGWCNFNLGNYTAALKDFDKGLKTLNGETAAHRTDLYRGMAYANLALDDKERAISCVNEASVGDSSYKSYGSASDLILIYYVSGDKENAWRTRGGIGYIGIHVEDNQGDSVKGAKIVTVMDASPAARAGLRIGDIVVKINNDANLGGTDFRSRINALTPGMSVTLQIYSQGVQRDVSLDVESVEPIMQADPLIARLLKDSILK
ncbi:MAG: PDZ domain-containing protein [Ignavibacteriales bacterium]|nr:PDZ domain-containing protein [Ignavibacteriales bacterium]